MFPQMVSASHPTTSGANLAAFPPTRWSVVLAAAGTPSPESASALETLCRAYWYPLYAFVRRSGQSPHDAQDLTQEFFRLLLEKRWLEDANQERGRLRTFLITAMKHFMAKEWRRANTQRRGGGIALVPMDTAFAESRYAADQSATLTAENVFDREWALTLLDLTLKRLEAEYSVAGKARDFAVLKGCLAAAHRAIDYGSAAGALEVSEVAARVAVHRLRKRFRELYREEVAQTLPDGAELDEEMRRLARILAQA